ncbi:MAG TPA: polysaccharide biosynthesis tyrosine autokinase [Chthoniobacterales bacterium]|nr:polysaccharide biosynthesis tyrosine autokinase [Chthoniobacterales bacterium]
MNATPDATLHLDQWRTMRSRVWLVILVFLLTLGGATIFTYLNPQNYIASATIDIQTGKTQPLAGQDSTTDSTKDSNFEENQLQAVFNHTVLDPVIQQLDLQTRWSRDGAALSFESAYDKLRRMIVLDVLAPHSIQVIVQGFSPEETTLLANTIAKEYINEQAFQQRVSLKKEADRLQKEVVLKETTVSNLFAEASRLRTAAGYVDPDPDSSDTSVRPEESASPTAEQNANEVQATIANLKIRLDALDHLKSDILADATGLLNLNDPILEQKLPLYQNANVEKGRLLSSGLGRNHPDVRAIQGQIDAIEEQIHREIANIRKALSAQLATAQENLVSIERNLSANQNGQKRKQANAQYLETKQRYDFAQAALATAKAKLESATAEAAKQPEPAVLSKLAGTASPTRGISNSLILLAGGAMGLLLGVMLALLAGALDKSIKRPEEVEKRLGLPLLAVIPKTKGEAARIAWHDPNDEAYQVLKTNVQAARQNVAASVLAVVGTGSGKGRSITTAKLATAYAASEQQTLVIDADLRRPSQHRFFGLDNRVGLSDYVRGEKPFDEIIRDSGTPNLFIITSGSGSSPTGAMKLFGSLKCIELVNTAKEWFDVVIFDCPPLRRSDGSLMISGLAEAAIIVAEHRRSPRSMVIKTKDALHNLGTKVLGVVLNSAYMKRRKKKLLPNVAVRERPREELAAEFQAASNRLRGDDAY